MNASGTPQVAETSRSLGPATELLTIFDRLLFLSSFCFFVNDPSNFMRQLEHIILGESVRNAMIEWSVYFEALLVYLPIYSPRIAVSSMAV